MALGLPVRGSEEDATDRGPTRRSRLRPSWWSQLAIIAFLLFVYDAINDLSPLHRATAIAHSLDVLHLENLLHLNPELALNQALAAHTTFGRFLGDYYNLAHFVVTLGVLGWVYWKYPGHFRLLRNALLLMNVVGFVVFWTYPLAPPRMLPSVGFVDIGVVTHSFGSATQNSAIAPHANEYAAMPSLHVAWALWCLAAVWWVRKDNLVRSLFVFHVVSTCVVVMATANHYLLDVVAGFATAAIGLGWAAYWERRVRPWSPEPAPA
jgi:hypothetical protein